MSALASQAGQVVVAFQRIHKNFHHFHPRPRPAVVQFGQIRDSEVRRLGRTAHILLGREHNRGSAGTGK